MPEVLSESAVALTVPADKSMMLVIRLTTAGVLARAGSTLDQMDALKSAVEEACTCLVRQKNPPERMTLKFSCEDDCLVFAAEGVNADSPVGDMDETEREVVKCILESVADEVRLDVRDGWLRGVEIRAALS